MSQFETSVIVSFGDCDPAKIVFYPNYFRWFDAAFHRFCAARSCSQERFEQELGSVGAGLMEVGARFKGPARPGDALALRLEVSEWRDKSFRLAYQGAIGGVDVVEGFEVRGLFVRDGGDRLRAAPVGPLRALLERDDDGARSG